MKKPHNNGPEHHCSDCREKEVMTIQLFIMGDSTPEIVGYVRNLAYHDGFVDVQFTDISGDKEIYHTLVPICNIREIRLSKDDE